MKAHVEAFVSERWSIAPESLRVELLPLGGGLESPVALATLEGTTAVAAAPKRMIVKQLPAGSGRQADIYQFLAQQLVPQMTAEVFGVHSVGNTHYVYLEEVRPCSAWPWADTSSAAAVCRVLACFHQSADLPREAFAWDYEADLARSAAATLWLARSARDHTGIRFWQRLGELARVVDALPEIRARLMSLGTAVIHGDVHPGNVILRVATPAPGVALIDWDRARIGSPLEDVASWLHSLGCWEPEARRRHDTLLRAYVDSRSDGWKLTNHLRTCYWFASVSNGLSGAIRYHLAVLADQHASDVARAHSAIALPAWQRVVRRAAALINTNRPRCN